MLHVRWIPAISRRAYSTAGLPQNQLLSDSASPTEQDREFLKRHSLLSQFVNTIMRDGKKATAQRVLFRTLGIVRDRTLKDPVATFGDSIESCAPLLKIRTRKKGSKNVPVPVPLKERQRRRQSIVWLLDQAEKRSEKKWEERLAGEILQITNGTSSILLKKEQLYKQALAARANVQFRN